MMENAILENIAIFDESYIAIFDESYNAIFDESYLQLCLNFS